MRFITLFDIISHLLTGLLITIILWPYTGAASLVFPLVAAAYLLHAWFNAAEKVADKAGFRPPTPVQKRYLDYLDTGAEVFTHPAIAAVAGIIASPKRQLILFTSGVFKELSEGELKELIAALLSRDEKKVFGWTYHLATGGAGLFKSADSDDPGARWGRMIVLSGTIGGIAVVVMGFLIAVAVSPLFGRQIDIPPIVPFFWLPAIFLTARFVWRRVNGALISPAAAELNRPVTLEQISFIPMSVPAGGYPNINILRSGLLIAGKRRANVEQNQK